MNGSCAFRHRKFEPPRASGNMFRKETRCRYPRRQCWSLFSAASRCAASAPRASAAPPRARPNQTQVRSRSGERVVRRSFRRREHESSGALQGVNGFFKASPHRSKCLGIGRFGIGDHGAHVSNLAAYRLAALKRQFTLCEVDRLNPVGSFINGGDPRVAHDCAAPVSSMKPTPP